MFALIDCKLFQAWTLLSLLSLSSIEIYLLVEELNPFFHYVNPRMHDVMCYLNSEEIPAKDKTGPTGPQ